MTFLPRVRASVRPSLLLILGLAASAPAVHAAAPVSLVSVSGHANFHAGGIVVTVSGDAERNASAALEWRAAGESAFRPGHPLTRVDATHFAGSVFWLQPGTSYDVRVTLSDPDGVTGTASGTASLATRAATLPEPTLRTLYVSPTGSDTNPGTAPGSPLRTVQRAATLAQAGDLVLIQPGIYRESVSVPRSGTATQPIVFRGTAPGVILDGADAAIAAGGTWTSQGSGVYSRAIGFSTGSVVADQGRLFQYWSTAELQGLAAGAPGGFFMNGTTLQVKLSDSSSPSSHVMHVARFEEGVVLDSRAFVRLENLEIQHYGSGGFGKGVYLRNCTDCAVRNSRISHIGAVGIWMKGGERNLIEGNDVGDTSIFGWPWPEVKGSDAETTSISLTDNVGRGNVVRGNTIHGSFDGISPCGNAAPAGGVLSVETDIYDNTLRQLLDDAFEAEGHCANVRVWGNHIEDVHMGFSVAPAGVGPMYFVRNVLYRHGNTRTSQQDGATSSAIKINHDTGTPVGPLFFYHNTIFTDAPATDAVALLNESGTASGIRGRNNLWAGTRYALSKSNPVALDWDGDDLYTSDGSRYVRWMSSSYASLAALRTGTGQEMQGLQAAPQLEDPAGGDFHPALGSPLIDRGRPLPGIDDDFSGVAPDIGAFEREDGPPVPSLSVADVTVNEGSSGTVAAAFVVTLSAPSTTAVTVQYATAPNTATEGVDYIRATGTLSFPAGTTSRTVNVTVNGDTTVEPDEEFWLNLSTPAGATLGDAQGVGRIRNDDTAPTPSLSIADVSVREGRRGPVLAVFTVTLSAASTQAVTVAFATADGTATSTDDYKSANGTLSFAPGVTSRTVTVIVKGDRRAEPDETFFVNLSGPVGATLADSQGRGTIVNDDRAPMPPQRPGAPAGPASLATRP
jgi:parallel beta-helix repeat protein